MILKAIRKDRNYTQEDLADALHISRSTLSGYENGARMDDRTIELICEVLKTDPNHLFGIETGEITLGEFMMAAEEMYERLYKAHLHEA